MKPESNDTFLSDWLADKISDAQLRELVTEEDFKEFLQLRNALDSYRISEPDMDRNYAAIKAKRIAENDRKPIRSISFSTYLAIAAMLLLFFGLYNFFAFSNTALTDFGKTETVALNDGSKVMLNARSEMSYPALFKFNRRLRLKGEAFFDVAKGSTFSVETAVGNVQVLGTQFDVVAQPGFFEVTCFAGHVKVTHGKETKILSVGDAVRFDGKLSESWKEPSAKPLWLTGESWVRNLAFGRIISKLEAQYGLQIGYPEHLKNVRFTGSFTHSNVDIALRSICTPMNLNYKVTSPGKIMLFE